MLTIADIEHYQYMVIIVMIILIYLIKILSLTLSLLPTSTCIRRRRKCRPQWILSATTQRVWLNWWYRFQKTPKRTSWEVTTSKLIFLVSWWLILLPGEILLVHYSSLCIIVLYNYPFTPCQGTLSSPKNYQLASGGWLVTDHSHRHKRNRSWATKYLLINIYQKYLYKYSIL